VRPQVPNQACSPGRTATDQGRAMPPKSDPLLAPPRSPSTARFGTLLGTVSGAAQEPGTLVIPGLGGQTLDDPQAERVQVCACYCFQFTSTASKLPGIR
jgi:hypothetical protein